MSAKLRRYGPVAGALLVALASILISAWRRPPELYQESAFLMKTYVKFQVADRNGEQAVARARAAMERVEGLLNRYSPASDVARVQGAPGRWVTVDPLTARAMETARLWGQRSGGLFDVTLGQLIDLYDFGGDGRVPAPHAIAAGLEHVGLDKWALQDVQARVNDSAAVLDLGGLHKGFAVDLATEELRSLGVKNALVDIGSNMYALGPRPDGKPWRIGVQHPRKPEAIMLVLPLQDRAVSTSGDYQQTFTRDGERFHHILDPRTGRPARGTASVTVLAPTAAEADILSTTLFVMGPEQGLKWLESYPQFDAVFVTEDLRILSSPGLTGALEVRP